jgi:predicted protein tyrosine phosphatase
MTQRYAPLPALSPKGGPMLFIGDLKAARDMEHEGVAVVTVSAVEPYKFAPTYRVLFEDGMGHEDGDEVKVARKCIRRGAKHIATTLSGKGRNNKKKNVLVHCWMGMNRSAAMICAYAVTTLGWDAKRAIKYVRERVRAQRHVAGVMQNKNFRDIVGALAKP